MNPVEEVTMKNVRLMFTVGCILLLISCGNKAPEIKNPAIVGKWEGNNQTFEMYPDGKISLTDMTTRDMSKGGYTFIDENTIRITFKSSKPQFYTITLSGDTLVVDSVNADHFAEYKRVS
jgi:hypothetical protein